MRTFFCLFLLPLILFAQTNSEEDDSYYQAPVKSPEEIQAELNAAEQEFKQALEVFNPWYTGPLITPSATMMPIGVGNSQPYIFVTDNHASYNSDRKSVSLPSKLIQLQGASNIQIGITNSFDLNLAFAAFLNWQSGEIGGGWGDMALEGGFKVLEQGPWIPGIKVTITQYFPTGKYKNLSLNNLGLNATGKGALSTRLAFAISKVVLWNTKHPMNMRLFMGYQKSPDVTVRNLNTYGGGRGARGKVSPGDVLSIDFGYEYSITQRWVFATDLVYTSSSSTSFRGTPGTANDGSPAVVGDPSNDNLSLSSAIEYNFNENIGFIGGLWFSVYGRNSLNFLSGVISVTITFP